MSSTLAMDAGFKPKAKDSKIKVQMPAKEKTADKALINSKQGLQSMQTADRIMWDLAAKYDIGNPTEIFNLDFIDRKKILSEFCAKATEAGCTLNQQGESIMKMRYPARVQGWQDVGKGQSASAIVIADSTRLDWYDLLEQGSALVEYQQILNGVFGRRLDIDHVDQINITKEVADLLYLIRNNQDKSLPLAPYVMFANVSDGGPGTKAFNDAAMLALEHRAACEKQMPDVDRRTHQLVVSDLNHKVDVKPSTSKFQLLCTVMDWSSGQMWVVDSGPGSKPVLFSDWASDASNLCKMLSVDTKDLDQKIKPQALELLMQLENPHAREQAAWDTLCRKIAAGAILDSHTSLQSMDKLNWYKEACRIWRYATILRQVRNVKQSQEHWQDIRSVKEAIGQIRHCCCNDCRQMWGDIKVLGALLSQDEFYRELYVAKKNGSEKFVIAPHYGCGFLGEIIEIHRMFETLGKELKKLDGKTSPHATPGYSDYARSMDFFKDKIQRLLEGEDNLGDFEALISRVPKELQAALAKAKKDIEYARVHGHGESTDIKVLEEDRIPEHIKKIDELARFLYTLIVDSDPNSMMVRAVLRRGVEVNLLNMDEGSDLLCMPAARTTYSRLQELYSGEHHSYHPFVSPKRVDALIVEQVSRDYRGRYEGWIAQLPRKERAQFGDIQIVMFLHNSHTGQSTVVPNEPKTREHVEDFIRQGYYNQHIFSPQEIEVFGMQEHGQYHLVA